MSFGRVVKRSYQLYLLQVRSEERMDIMRGFRITPKTIEQIRAEYEEEHGSRFMEI
jgi:hypothetical protein